MYMDLRFYAIKTVVSLDVIILVFFVLAYEFPNTLNSIKPRRHTVTIVLRHMLIFTNTQLPHHT